MRKMKGLIFKCGYSGKMAKGKWAEGETEAGEELMVQLKTQETVDN